MGMTMERALGCEIRKARQALKKSQEALAFEAEIHRTYVSLIELGKKSPTFTVIVKLAHALNIKPSELLRRVEVKFEQSNI
jgi:transcriptional regulator with XRE-family HTH domain